MENMTDDPDWPARAYVYGTWGYALQQACERAKRHRMKMWLYRGFLDGDVVWIVAWDPKK